MIVVLGPVAVLLTVLLLLKIATIFSTLIWLRVNGQELSRRQHEMEAGDLQNAPLDDWYDLLDSMEANRIIPFGYRDYVMWRHCRKGSADQRTATVLIYQIFYRVPALMDDFVNTVNRNWEQTDPVVLAAFVLWRLNNIHPFINGNGRTARACAYFVLCVRAGGWLAGQPILFTRTAVHDRHGYRHAHGPRSDGQHALHLIWPARGPLAEYATPPAIARHLERGKSLSEKA